MVFASCYLFSSWVLSTVGSCWGNVYCCQGSWSWGM